MANDVQNNNEIDEDNINIDDIEGLERDLPSEENKSNIGMPSSEDAHEVLPDGKLKTTSSTTTESVQNESEQEHMIDNIKNNKKFKIILVVLIVLIVMIIGLIYFSTSKEKIEVKPPVENTTPKELPPIETYQFKLDHINVSRLNKKLENLNKYELLGMTEEEYLKEEKRKAFEKAQEEAALKEKMRLEQEALEKEALEKARLEEELALKAKEESTTKQIQGNKTAPAVTLPSNQVSTDTQVATDTSVQNNVEIAKDEQGNTFLKFIQINTNKKSIYKSYLQKIKTVDSRINPCRNINNVIEIFVGPLNADENFNAIIEGLKNTKLSEDVTFIEVTKEEFEKRCMVSEN